jgi:hypothetical protein
MGHEVEAGFERVRDRIRGTDQLTTRQARPTVNLTDPCRPKEPAECADWAFGATGQSTRGTELTGTEALRLQPLDAN